MSKYQNKINNFSNMPREGAPPISQEDLEGKEDQEDEQQEKDPALKSLGLDDKKSEEEKAHLKDLEAGGSFSGLDLASGEEQKLLEHAVARMVKTGELPKETTLENLSAEQFAQIAGADASRQVDIHKYFEQKGDMGLSESHAEIKTRYKEEMEAVLSKNARQRIELRDKASGLLGISEEDDTFSDSVAELKKKVQNDLELRVAEIDSQEEQELNSLLMKKGAEKGRATQSVNRERKEEEMFFAEGATVEKRGDKMKLELTEDQRDEEIAKKETAYTKLLEKYVKNPDEELLAELVAVDQEKPMDRLDHVAFVKTMTEQYLKNSSEKDQHFEQKAAVLEEKLGEVLKNPNLSQDEYNHLLRTFDRWVGEKHRGANRDSQGMIVQFVKAIEDRGEDNELNYLDGEILKVVEKNVEPIMENRDRGEVKEVFDFLQRDKGTLDDVDTTAKIFEKVDFDDLTVSQKISLRGAYAQTFEQEANLLDSYDHTAPERNGELSSLFSMKSTRLITKEAVKSNTMRMVFDRHFTTRQFCKDPKMNNQVLDKIREILESQRKNEPFWEEKNEDNKNIDEMLDNLRMGQKDMYSYGRMAELTHGGEEAQSLIASSLDRLLTGDGYNKSHCRVDIEECMEDLKKGCRKLGIKPDRLLQARGISTAELGDEKEWKSRRAKRYLRQAEKGTDWKGQALLEASNKKSGMSSHHLTGYAKEMGIDLNREVTRAVGNLLVQCKEGRSDGYEYIQPPTSHAGNIEELRDNFGVYSSWYDKIAEEYDCEGLKIHDEKDLYRRRVEHWKKGAEEGRYNKEWARKRIKYDAERAGMTESSLDRALANLLTSVFKETGT